MKIATAQATDGCAVTAVDTAVTTLLTRLVGWPSYIFVTAAALDAETVSARLAALLPGVAIHGTTSCGRLPVQEEQLAAKGGGLTLLGVRDPCGCYGVGLAAWSESEAGSARAAGRAATLAALADAGRSGEAPGLVWLSGTPGREEDVLAGVQDLLGPKAPISAGSAADNDLAETSGLFTASGVSCSAVLITAMFPTAEVGLVFEPGYRSTG